MATRKCEVIVRRLESTSQKDYLQVHADSDALDVIKGVEGVMDVSYTQLRAHLVIVDPRYDTDEVITDIERAIKGARLLQQWTQDDALAQSD